MAYGKPESRPTNAVGVGHYHIKVARTRNATGTLAAYEAADLLPRAAERIPHVTVKAGQFVSQGAPLVRLDRGNRNYPCGKPAMSIVVSKQSDKHS